MPSTYNEFVGFQKQLANYNQNWLISLQWDNFCDFGATFSGFGTLFTNIILLWIQTFEKKSDHPNPPKKPKNPKKRLMDFHDGISCQRFELEGWDLVQCLLISFCFGSEILKKIRPPEPQKKTKKPQKKTYGFSQWDNLPTL